MSENIEFIEEFRKKINKINLSYNLKENDSKDLDKKDETNSYILMSQLKKIRSKKSI